MNKETLASGTLSICIALGIGFTFLKALDFLDWSWLWVTAPFWMPMAICLGLGAAIVVIAVAAMMADSVFGE